jgi:hypothetical protein
MSRIPVIGTGPVPVTTNGAHKTIPLGALTFDANNNISFADDWPPGDTKADQATKQAAAMAWLNFLVQDAQLAPAATGATGKTPAFLIEATHAGAAGNAITLTISDVMPQLPLETMTFDLEIDIVNTYAGLTLATIAGTIGTTAGSGSRPGLVFLGSAAPPTKLPDGVGNPMHVTGTPPHADVKNGPDVAFTLDAPGDGGGAGTFDVEVSAPAADHSFDLKVTWKKKVVGKTLGDHAMAFGYVVEITKPLGGYAVPAAGTITLSGGADPGQPAKGTVVSA